MSVKAILAAAALSAVAAHAAHGAVLISEVYGGGGNTGAPFNQDFVELYNNGTVAVPLDGFTLQYASPTGSFTNTILTFPTGTSINPGQFFVVEAGPAGTTGADFTANATGATNPNLGATSGAVRLIDASTPTPQVLDLVGYGTATNFEGLAAAAPGPNTTSLQRINLLIDTDQNAADFTALAPTPGAAVPEPASAVSLLGLAALAAIRRSRRVA